LLGDGSHGTSEYYSWRTVISQRLIREKGFNCIAIEGEWADSHSIDSFIKGPLTDSAAAIAVLSRFNRWPAWMWANEEAAHLVGWLQAENQTRLKDKKIGFYGLDLYCMWESIAALKQIYNGGDTAIRSAINASYACLSPFGPDAMIYAKAIIQGAVGCGTETGHLWNLMKNRQQPSQSANALFAQEQFALVAEDGERYFHNISNGVASWNLRENHMYTTIRRLLALYGPASKIIVWAHNTHVGDARFSTMSLRHKISIGQLLRQAYGDQQVFIIGLGGYTGTVLSGRSWGDTIRNVILPPARPGSWEDALHTQGGYDRIIFSNTLRNTKGLNSYFYTRAVGAIYQPATDAYSVYTSSLMHRRYNAFIYLEKTSALHPISVKTDYRQAPFLYPTGE
jgi:erythromycin esterase-like protein